MAILSLVLRPEEPLLPTFPEGALLLSTSSEMVEEELPPVVDTEFFGFVAPLVGGLVSTAAILVALAVEVLVG